MHPRRSSIARWLPWLLIPVCAPLLGHCGGAADSSTETGNPPVVAAERLHIVLRDTGVEVVGDAGAVSAGSTVSVTNLSTGDRTVATARADGSVNVVVPGSLQDEYELTVSNGAGSQTLRISASTNGGAAGSAGTTGGSDTSIGGTTGTSDGFDLASASCETLESTLDETAAAASAAASTDCQSDSDCSSEVLQNAVRVCTELSRRCSSGASPRCPNLSLTLACTNQKCQGLSCDGLRRTALFRVDVTLTSAPRNCMSAADCSLIRNQVCDVDPCSVPFHSVASSAVPQLMESMQGMDATLCGEFERRDCPQPMPLPCPSMPQPRAVCVAGQCDVEYVIRP